MTKSEAKFQIIFKHWAHAHWTGGSAGFELKRTLTDRFYLPNIKPHQITALKQAKHGMLYHKIADDSIGTKPFDCFILQHAESYVVIAFGPRVSFFYIIPVDIWAENTVDKKSITCEEVGDWQGVITVTVPKKHVTVQ